MKHIGKRVGCVALAAQMLLSPAAQAAEPLRQALDEDMRTAIMSHSANFLEQKKQQREETFPQLRKLAKAGGKIVAQAAGVDNVQNTAAAEMLEKYSENDNGTADSDAESDVDASISTDVPADSETILPPETEETTLPETPEEPDPEAEETTLPETPEESDPEAGETTFPETPEESDPEAGETTLPDTPEESAPPAAEPTTPDTGSAVPGEEPGTPANQEPTAVETTSPDKTPTPAESMPAGEGAILPLEKLDTAKPEKELLNVLSQEGKQLMSSRSVASGSLVTQTVLAIFGFGPEYRIPKLADADGQAIKHPTDYDEGSGYKYNIEDPEGKTWFYYRDAAKGYWDQDNDCGTDNERWAYENDVDGYAPTWHLKPFSAGLYNFAYLYAQTFDAEGLRLIGDNNFVWNATQDEQFFTGALPGSAGGIALPRLPNKEFTNEWYVLGSKTAQLGAGDGITIDGFDSPVSAYSTFWQLFTAEDSGKPINYQNMVYNEERDFYRFDSSEPLNQFDYWSANPISTSTAGIYNGYRAMMDPPWDSSFNSIPTTLPLIGKWKDSSNATLTALGMTQKLEESGKGAVVEDVELYPINSSQSLSDLKAMTYLELAQAEKKFSADNLKYFLRLPASATELAIRDDTVVSYEPGSQVTLLVSYEGIAAPEEYILSGKETTTYNENEKYAPENSRENPARSVWTLPAASPSIPVVIEDKDQKEHELVSITVQVVPPSKEALDTKEYTIEIQRLQDPRMEKGYGNTPMGMIERNDSGYDSHWASVEEDTRKYFTNQYQFNKLNKWYPADSKTNNEGYVWMGDYNREAWVGAVNDKTANVDLDETALVVYLNSEFDVPGFSIYDSLGQKSNGATEIDDPSGKQAADGTPAKIQNVKWKLEMTLVGKLEPGKMTYVAPNSGDTWSGEGNVGKISLVDYNVKPGVYKLSYTYTDPYDGREHIGDSFDCTVVVLPLHGDVDMDGSVTPADGVALRGLLNNDPDKFFNDSLADSTSRLYYYRVCNVTEDGRVDEKDVERLLQGYSPKLRDTERNQSDYFYLPLSGDRERYAVETSVNSDPSVPSVSLKYLGAGAEAPDNGGRVNYDPGADSTFWMELQINNLGALNAAQGDLTSFTATLTYNSDYVEPCWPESVAHWGDYVLSLNSQWQGWELQLVHRYEVQDNALVAVPVETGITPVNTPNKAKSLLDGWTSVDALREVRFSVTPTADAVNANPLTASANGGVLKLPFKLTKFPSGMTDTDYKLVELALGPRDFLMTTEQNGNAMAALWDNNPAYTTATTNNINLKDMLAFAGSDDVKLGKDTTPCYYVYVSQANYAEDVASTSAYGKNLVYGYGQAVDMNSYGVRDGMPDVQANREYFTGIGASIQWSDPSNLPGTVVYTPGGHMTVTPLKAGTFDFTIDGSDIPYRLVVDKCPLTLTVDNVKKFYGETTSTGRTFTYDKDQIRALDIAAHPSAVNTGDGADLGKLIDGYTAPSIRLMTAVDKGSETTAATVPGDYAVIIEGGVSDNYIFNYVRADKPAADKEHISGKLGTAVLTVLPRPLLVQKVIKDPVSTLAENSIQYGVTGTAKTDEFTLAGVDSRTDLTKYDSTDGTIDGVPITPTITVVGNDELELAYVGVVKKNASDPAYGFAITGDKESRVVDISSISFTEDGKTQNDRYVLMNEKTRDPVNPNIQYIHPLDSVATANVEKRKMLKMEVVHLPSRMNYTYGQTLDLGQLLVEAYFSDKPNRAEQAGHSLANLQTALGIEAFWVNDDTSVPGANSEAASDGERLHVADRDGKYLCLMDGETKSVFAYVGPFHVSKQTLTLTLRTETRFYGETISQWTVGYNNSQLAEWDRIDHPAVSGNIDDLATWMDGFTAPVMTPRQGKLLTSKPVTETTDVGGYYTLISGASASNYQFNYTRTGVSGAEGTGDDFGYAPLNIERRPILITSVDGSAGSMYHDTRSYIVDPARAVAGGNAAGFRAALPKEGETYYAGDFTSYIWDGRWALTRSAIQADDTLTALYRGEFLKRDNEQMPFYTLAGNEPSRTVDVQVTELRLAGDRSKNYLLLFPTADAASNGWAGSSEADSRTTGTVYLRKIVSVKLAGPSKVDYVYGEPLELAGLTATITYASDGGEAPVVESVSYDDIVLDGVATTTFKRLGLTLHMGSQNGAAVENGQRLSVAEHDGRFLYVTGPQYESGSVVNDRTPRALNIQKRTLNLTATDITRKYGEENGVYSYTFEVNDLAEWDRGLLGSNDPSGTASALNTASTSAALAAVNAPYEIFGGANRFVAPQFTTLAANNSPVKGSPYELNVVGGSMANYKLVMHPGQINVERRPIRLETVTKDPIYIVSQNAFSSMNSNPKFKNVVCTQDELVLSIPAGESVTGSPVVAGDNISLRIVDATVYGTRNSSGTVPPPTNAAAFGNEYEIKRNAVLEKIELLPGGDNDNYVLANTTTASGALSPLITVEDQVIVHRRVIESIRAVRSPNKMRYTYGEPMDLSGILLEITYQKSGASETVTVDPTVMEDVFINYWDADKPALTKEELNADDSLLQVHPAVNGDHLTIAVDADGFTHNGKKLMISARTYAGQPYVDSVFIDEPIVMDPRELTYTLKAEDKDYDHSRDAVGAITLTNVYGDDEVWVKNGTDYTGGVPSNYTFTSGDYTADGYDGLKFTFVDENVSYGISDDHDIFVDLLDIPVEVTALALAGWDMDNYHINTEVLTDTVQLPGRDGVPSARIMPIERPAPGVKTSLWVDEHTNTVKILTHQSAEDFGDDLDSRNILHYEYALIYENELGGIVITDYQDDPYFGGEPVTVEKVDYVPNANGSESIEDAGDGQILDSEDVLFGTRTALPRGTWIGGLVRIAKTNNYYASAGQSSFDPELQVREDDNNDAQLLTSLADAAQAAAALPLPEPEKDTDRQAERLQGPVIKTYTYRLDIVSTSQQKNSEGGDVYVPTLLAVWFTDVADYVDTRVLDRLVENLNPTRYYGYYWDPTMNTSISFPMAMGEDILVEIPVVGGSSGERVETLVNPDGTARIYVKRNSVNSGGAVGTPRRLEILPDELTLEGPGETAQLRVLISPASLFDSGVVWTSSDERVVTVSNKGKVTAIGPGVAIITAATKKGEVSDSITVTVLGQPQGNNYPYGDTMFNSAYLGTFFDLLDGGRFDPEGTMTRRELAVVMNHFFQEAAGQVPRELSNYVDLGDDPSNSAIENLDRWDIVTGVDVKVFAPDRIVTRAEMSVMLCRMLMIPVNNDPNAPHAFSDAQPGINWAWAYIDALAKAGITKGTGGDKYSPERLLTRAEVATFLCRALITTVDKTRGPIVIPTDVTEDYWAYASILRAVNNEPAVRLIDEYLPTTGTEKETGKK